MIEVERRTRPLPRSRDRRATDPQPVVTRIHFRGAIIGQLSFVNTGHGEHKPDGLGPRRAAK
jgi:hypothetical protein